MRDELYSCPDCSRPITIKMQRTGHGKGKLVRLDLGITHRHICDSPKRLRSRTHDKDRFPPREKI